MSEATHIDTQFKEKFLLIKPWMSDMLNLIKKDLRQEHLSQDREFFNFYFRGKTLNKLTTEELANAYMHAIQHNERSEEIGEFIFHRWLLKNSDIYHFFEKELSKLSEDYTSIKSISRDVSIGIKDRAAEKFGVEDVYIFCLFNGVAFDPELMEELRAEAIKTQNENKERLVEQKATQDLESKFREYETQISRLTDRYESRLAGLEHKYDKDVTALKKQVAHLQRQLQAKS